MHSNLLVGRSGSLLSCSGFNATHGCDTSCTGWNRAEQGSSELIQMRAFFWSIACVELCYGSQWICCWRSLRFSNEGSLGMCLRACSQSLGAPLWSLSPASLSLLLNMALKSTWGFWKANREQEHIHQVLIQCYHRSVILSTESLIAVWLFSPRFWEWLMHGVHTDCSYMPLSWQSLSITWLPLQGPGY